MDITSHILIGILVAIIISLTLTQSILLIIGIIIPDLAFLPLYLYYKTNYENFKKDSREKPKAMFKIYDFFHSILLIILLIIASIYKPILVYLILGLIIHIIIDIPLHKKHPTAIFFPFKTKIKGKFDWYEIYNSISSRIILWLVLIILIILVYFSKMYI